MPRVGLIGDYNDSIVAHRAIPLALRASPRAAQIDFEWIASDAPDLARRITDCDGLWCVPGSPYRSMHGALAAIGFARAQNLPFLGTCGGFQHAIIEYARSVLGWQDADHAETAHDAARAVISPLSCGLVEVTAALRLLPGSRIAAAYAREKVSEGYHCNYGLNPAFGAALLAGPLRASAVDAAGEVRAVELDAHPFFVATLFQPERAALRGEPAPLVNAFVEACAA